MKSRAAPRSAFLDLIPFSLQRTKEKKSYQDNLEDEIEGKRRFDVQEKLESDKYKFVDDEHFVRNMEGKGKSLRSANHNI